MLQWAQAIGAKSQRLLVLLGDYGTGKTSHGQQFTRILNNKISHSKWPHDVSDKNAVNALFIDLSELSGISNLAALSLEEMLVLVLKKRDGLRITHVADVAPLLADARAGRLIMVFDGLDELLKNDSLVLHKVFDQILRVVEPTADNASTPQPKAIISCRSHYFRDIEAQHSFFTARRRSGGGGVSDQDYLMLTLLPWGNDLIERYLTKRLGDDAPRLIEIIHNTYNLEELASRPVLLGMMSEHIMALLQKSDDGSKIVAADLYNLTVASWIERDNGKHRIQGHQKPLLMGALAAAMLDDGAEAWPADKLDTWLQRTVNRLFPGTYNMKELASIQEDLRTATFIVRTGARDFSFAHKSYAEYFVARFILDGVDQVRYGAVTEKEFHALLPNRELNSEAMQFLIELWISDCNKLPKQETLARIGLFIGILQRNSTSGQLSAPSFHASIWGLLRKHAPNHFNHLTLRKKTPINLRWLDFQREKWLDINLQSLPPLDVRGATLIHFHARQVKFGVVLCDRDTYWKQAVFRNCDTTLIQWKYSCRSGLRLRTTHQTIYDHQLEPPLAGLWTMPLLRDHPPLGMSVRKFCGTAATHDCKYILHLFGKETVATEATAPNQNEQEIAAATYGDARLAARTDGSLILKRHKVITIGETSKVETKQGLNGALIRRYSVLNPLPPFEPSWAEFDEQWRLVAYNDAAAEHWLFRIRDGVAEPIEAAL